MIEHRVTVPTREGQFLAVFTEAGLAGLHFPAEAGLGASDPTLPIPQTWREWLGLTARGLEQALAGERIATPPPLDERRGTPFQREVWQALRRIPPGETCTYAGIARAIGRPRAIRAVGQACGANPIPVFTPCHRVVAAGGKLGGFSGGLDWKRLLLERERVSPRANAPAWA